MSSRADDTTRPTPDRRQPRHRPGLTNQPRRTMRRPIRVRGDDPGRWDDGGRRLLERIDDTARQELEGFPNYADPETGAWVTSPGGRLDGRLLGRRAVARL